MFYLNERLGADVVDLEGRAVGRLTDVVLAADSDTVAGVALKSTDWDEVMVSVAELDLLAVPWPKLRVAGGGWTPVSPAEDDIWLARDVLDHRVVDARHARLARVNAVLMEESGGGWRVVGVEVGSRGLLARLGAAGLADALHISENLIPWADVGLAQGRTERLEQMHPAELAAIVHELPPAQGSDLVEALNDEVAADTMEEVHPDRQADLLEDMAPERAADILEEMAPDEAADVLQDMSEEKQEELLQLMEKEEAAEAKELLAHDEDSAGGIMTTEYATLPPDLTAGQALAELRRRYADELDELHYVYLTDPEEHVLGVTALWDLVIAEPGTKVDEFMDTKVVSVRPDADAEEAARLISKYGILSIPVVDAENRILGVVTVDDAMDLILPEDWRGHLRRM